MPDQQPLFTLPGRVAIVTGGTRGIGRSIAETLLNAQCEVAVCGRHEPASLPSVNGRTASFHACDLRDAGQARAFVDSVAERHGRLDILVNNAGGSPQADAATASPRFSEAILALNLLAPLHAAQAANRVMATQETGGSIINIASVSAIRPSPGTAIYGAAKAGLLSLTRSLAQEWGPAVRVNAIVVGLIETENAEETYGSAIARDAIASSLPLRRMGRGDDVAAAALYLASPLAAYVSGAQLNVDGGGERPLFLEIVKSYAKPD
ncbi:SDR family oxidoreductase [Azospirillum agricola]|uniref:SDR family oxidoreductase n=1 Tax=Azospirillum agricola TaxID=1720247 RepID=UPI000A0F3720|nr:SDR family oxidoreductase [Azospirillum agricola]SMH37759.1 NAD(P)-dependent dehydrogenase, short-chain alcohol dehydrogenase family [Azospirillum lipoferum]